MSFRAKLLGLKQMLLSGIVQRRKTQLKRALGIAVCFILGLLCSSVRIFGYISPFGTAITAQAGAGIGGIATLLGASAGYLIFGGFDWGIRYVATCVLIFTISFVFQSTKVYNTRWFMPTAAGIVCTVTAALNSFSYPGWVEAAILVVFEVVLAAGCTYFFSVALSQEQRDTDFSEIRHGVGVIILLACIFMAFSDVMILDVVSVGRMAATVTVMAYSLSGGSLSGCGTGAAMGLAMDLAAGGTPYFAMAYTFSGLISGSFSKHGKLTFALSYIIANAAAVAWTWQVDFRSEILYETL